MRPNWPAGDRDVDRRAGRLHTGHESLRPCGQPADAAIQAAYVDGPYAGVAEQALQGLAALEPADADAGTVATAIADIVAAPAGKRPYRVFVDPSQDGAEEVFRVGDRIRREMFRNIGLADLLAARVGG